jgi:hypothetical protein
LRCNAANNRKRGFALLSWAKRFSKQSTETSGKKSSPLGRFQVMI